ncbi:hypothetical protein [Flavobacterium sp.]|uniref:hypothetical protein n=1 Tax=Flavobacterium sp. TaxID=239 RepID=UPI00286C41B9|nr:hypothetical protein [Flavobacterium sp.]
MKTIKQTLLAVSLLLVATFTVTAQNQMFTIHADYVKPSMEKEYISVSKEYVAECKKHNLQNADFTTIRLDNGTYLSFETITNMAALDTDSSSPLADKMGKENYQALLARFNKCYDRHGSYVINRIESLTYMPEGANAAQEGNNYRKYHYLYVTPSNAASVGAKIKAIKDLYAKKGSKMYFRVYHSGYGTLGEYFLIAVSAKDEQAHAIQSTENNKLLGEEIKPLMDDLLQSISRYDPMTGYIRTDLSYTATK